MLSDTLLLVGGCSGSFAAPTENRPVFDADSPHQVRYVPFSRQKYGSRTSSYFLRHRDTWIVVDQGLGIEPISEFIIDMLKAERVERPIIHLLQTHYHEDHIEGLRANALMFQKGTTLRFYSPRLQSVTAVRGLPTESPSPTSSCPLDPCMMDVLEAEFCKSYWPVTLDILDQTGATREHEEFQPGDTLQIDDVTIRSVMLSHPGGCVGYRFDFPQSDPVVLATDYEPSPEIDPAVVEFFDGAGLLLTDMQYRHAEYEGQMAIGQRSENRMSRVGWGHATPELLFPYLVRTKRLPRKIRVVHHDPKRSDEDLESFREESYDILCQHVTSGNVDYGFAADGELYWL
ncbi:MBL fold metallo-hydrolase [Thalassoroseus pseudoceratinae]|uniref:MBL fold metallo-hydrolase n=1 Tax=Thalassoroseus pseudoceratinae TaxID=2713176 RepID=UPI00141FE159|nr:MBL fold metallo-hydrolase [Thalassoroseus pseudoceratinae]